MQARILKPCRDPVNRYSNQFLLLHVIELNC